MTKAIQAFILLALFALPVFAKTPPTIYLAGDSTMAKKQPEKRPETGWGEFLEQFFKPGEVVVANQAVNGRSTKSFIAEGKWQRLVDALKPGDYVFIQFGHNDESKDKAERYTPPADYKANLTRMVGDVVAKKAFPVLLTPVMRRRFDKEGKFYDTHGEYPDLVRAVASETKTPLLDLHRKTAELLIKYGPEESRKLFLQLKEGEHPNYPKGIDDNTHFSPKGAEEVAKLAVEEIKASKLKIRKRLTKW
jgi:lysophospholipase L1-like esterase